ncbi:MAG TPA: hypothetical protein DIC56_12185 [Rhizobium sp.]|nr:hypothetical protein [Rhizobium sp.]
MPASSYRGRAHPTLENKIPTLEDADGLGQFVRAGCVRCKTIRFYRPADIRKLIGENIHILRLQEKFRCDQCRTKEYMAVEFKTLLAREIPGLVVRELVEVQWVKRPVWRDRKL